MNKMKAFNVRLSEELWFHIKEMALEQRRSMNEYITILVQKDKKKVDGKNNKL
jgi:predicted HicB family RNase H-like nuclease